MLLARPDVVESVIHALSLQQFLVRAVLDQLPSIDDIDPMRRTDRAQPMGNDDDRAAFADLRHVLLNDRFGFIVQRAGGFIENENARVGHQRAGNRNPLALATGSEQPCSPTSVS